LAEKKKISKIEQLCLNKGMKMTGQRKIIARVLSESNDHPDVEQIHKRSSKADSRISIATIYRTIRLLEENNIIVKHEFADGKARYEQSPQSHHDHLININTGEVVEFRNDEIEKLQKKVAEDHGYNLVDHKLELYVVPKEKNRKK